MGGAGIRINQNISDSESPGSANLLIKPVGIIDNCGGTIITRTYTDWKTITCDVINARVWEGVHYRTSDITGVEQGLRVARWELGRLASSGIWTGLRRQAVPPGNPVTELSEVIVGATHADREQRGSE